jgi:3-methyladenine DNA glycosylase Tag
MGRPVQARCCYPIEICLKTLHKKCRNKGKIEASIAEAYILEEVSNFIEKYYAKNLPSVHNPSPCYNAGENESNLSLFRGQLRSASASTSKTLTHEGWRCIMLYVLNNLDEVVLYIG